MTIPMNLCVSVYKNKHSDREKEKEWINELSILRRSGRLEL